MEPQIDDLSNSINIGLQFEPEALIQFAARNFRQKMFFPKPFFHKNLIFRLITILLDVLIKICENNTDNSFKNIFESVVSLQHLIDSSSDCPGFVRSLHIIKSMVELWHQKDYEFLIWATASDLCDLSYAVFEMLQKSAKENGYTISNYSDYTQKLGEFKNQLLKIKNKNKRINLKTLEEEGKKITLELNEKTLEEFSSFMLELSQKINICQQCKSNAASCFFNCGCFLCDQCMKLYTIDVYDNNKKLECPCKIRGHSPSNFNLINSNNDDFYSYLYDD